MVCFHITTYESREVRGITLQNIWDKTYKHWQILIKTTGSFSGLVSGNCRPGDKDLGPRSQMLENTCKAQKRAEDILFIQKGLSLQLENKSTYSNVISVSICKKILIHT